MPRLAGYFLLEQHLSPHGSSTGLFFSIIRHTESFPFATLNGWHSTSASAVHYGNSRGKNDTLSATVFLIPLSNRASHFILQDFLELYVCMDPAVFPDASCKPPGVLVGRHF